MVSTRLIPDGGILADDDIGRRACAAHRQCRVASEFEQPAGRPGPAVADVQTTQVSREEWVGEREIQFRYAVLGANLQEPDRIGGAPENHLIARRHLQLSGRAPAHAKVDQVRIDHFALVPAQDARRGAIARTRSHVEFVKDEVDARRSVRGIQNTDVVSARVHPATVVIADDEISRRRCTAQIQCGVTRKPD